MKDRNKLTKSSSALTQDIKALQLDGFEITEIGEYRP